MTGYDPDSLWTGQRIGLNGKPHACWEWPAATKGNSLKKGSQPLCKDLWCTAFGEAKRVGEWFAPTLGTSLID